MNLSKTTTTKKVNVLCLACFPKSYCQSAVQGRSETFTVFFDNYFIHNILKSQQQKGKQANKNAHR